VIEIDRFKQELEQARKTGDKEEIGEKEREATNVILRALYDYPYQNTNKF